MYICTVFWLVNSYQAKMVMSAMEAEANNKLVEAGDSLDVVSVHLRYLQTMMRINGPQNHNHGFIIPFPLEMLRFKQSIAQSGLTTLINIVRNKELMINSRSEYHLNLEQNFAQIQKDIRPLLLT